MKYKIIILGCVFFVTGCANQLPIGELSSADKVEVIDSNVSNPYPECKDKGKMRRMADLEVERGERVYLQKGGLCKRSNY